MRIDWTQNPLRSIVLLNDADRWALREAMEIELGPDDDNAYMNDLHTEYEAALRDIHVGDCTCDPCSCLKCWAETYLGIDTTPGLAKYMAYQIAGAFNQNPEPALEEAITALATYNPKPSSPMWDGKLDLWERVPPSMAQQGSRLANQVPRRAFQD